VTAPTPEQLRALADRIETGDDYLVKEFAIAEMAALRAAADQLEAVQAEAREWREAVPVDVLRAILTADTAPERHHPACGALDEPCHCVERGDAPPGGP
jgi:hypothetical protein